MHHLIICESKLKKSCIVVILRLIRIEYPLDIKMFDRNKLYKNHYITRNLWY